MPGRPATCGASFQIQKSHALFWGHDDDDRLTLIVKYLRKKITTASSSEVGHKHLSMKKSQVFSLSRSHITWKVNHSDANDSILPSIVRGWFILYHIACKVHYSDGNGYILSSLARLILDSNNRTTFHLRHFKSPPNLGEGCGYTLCWV